MSGTPHVQELGFGVAEELACVAVDGDVAHLRVGEEATHWCLVDARCEEGCAVAIGSR